MSEDVEQIQQFGKSWVREDIARSAYEAGRLDERAELIAYLKQIEGGVLLAPSGVININSVIDWMNGQVQ